MDLCEHAFYKPEETYTPRLYCKIDDKMCVYSKRCLKVDRFIPLEGEKWRECYKYIMEKRKNIPQGSYLVQATRPHKNGNLYLYVLIDENKIEKILSNFKKFDQEYVYLKKSENGKYQISLEPFTIEQEFMNKPEIVEEKNETKENKVETKEIESKPKKRTYNKSSKKKEPKIEKYETERD